MSEQQFKELMLAKLALGLLDHPFSVAWAKMLAERTVQESKVIPPIEQEGE